MVIGLGAALLAAVLFGVAAVVQAIASRRHGLFSWMMVGVGVAYLLGWGLHLVSIAYVPLYVAQVGIALSLVVTALLAATVVGEPLALRHWVAVGTMVGGWRCWSLAAGAVGQQRLRTERTLLLYVGSAVTLVLGLIAIRYQGERQRLSSSASSAASRTADRRSRPAPLVDPDLDAETIAACAHGRRPYGLLGFWLCSVALRRASVTAANAPLMLLETLVPAVVGVPVFNDGVRAGWWPVAVGGFVLSTAGALVLAGPRRGSTPRTPIEQESERQPL